ncbi:gephyrin-like molybdotransferase Glp [Brevundimonas subvibrioides]|uniref:Molybdopterin molybdenumtransferase n=1 Tax=Brevundimonas subvibrioides (strain ATCC 15264 / DSM 4735 / LMG 14903 / NBRC 16000 / CB 81) TaxID=633149 RepID=D9QIB8_BRESC|nr:gephyrin-like molybdotransferase Glp [Brevundimonas subvibrioides]ADK99420.1 molybdenum cofactor synthesis domain protein [Brevundimonas subvibrioides ATCC 15264]
MSLPTVETARAAMLTAVGTPAAEPVPLIEADGRWLAEPVVALRDQPPFDASAMDGWAVRTMDLGTLALRIVGESAAGRGRDTPLGPGETVRIFTGAPLPPGADRVVIQEEASRDGDHLTVPASADAPAWVRPRGADYGNGARLLEAGLRLSPWRVALAASAGRPEVLCARRPRVAILAGGDEVVEPGTPAGPYQIHDAAGPGVALVARRAGAEVRRLALVGDTLDAIAEGLGHASADLIVTIGGASVGDHDLLKPAARTLGATLLVEGVAMRPGKPVWFATLPDGRLLLGLPGNPVSALVCAELFLVPLLAAMQGGRVAPAFRPMTLAEALPANGPRDHYMRAVIVRDEDGLATIRALPDQDSSMVTVLAGADALLRRPPHAPALAAGDPVPVAGLDV